MALKALCPVLLILLIGCASHKRHCENCFYGTGLVARFDPQTCHDLPQGRFTCSRVVFDPITIPTKKGGR